MPYRAEPRMKKLTILILTHDREPLLARAVKSVCKFLDECNVIVLNNGEALSFELDSRIEYHHIYDLELTDSYKFLISQSKTEFSVFLEDDDYIYPKNILKAIENNPTDILLGNMMIHDPQEGRVQEKSLWENFRLDPQSFIQKYFYYDRDCEFQLGNLVFKTSLAQEVVFPPSNIICMDEFFLFRLVSLARSIGGSSSIFYSLFIHDNNISWNNDENIILNGEKHIDFAVPFLYNNFEEEIVLDFELKYRTIYRRRIEKACNNNRTYWVCRKDTN